MSKENMTDQKMEYYSLNAKLCRLVQANPCMYDRSCSNYLKKEYVERAWANIAQEVNDSVGSCKERWRNIRTAFARSVNIYKTPAGPNRHKRYYLHDELQFLTKHIAPGLPSLPVRLLTPTDLEENTDNSRLSVDEPDDSNTFQITIESSTSPPPVQIDEPRITTPEPEYTELQSSPVPKRRKPNEQDEYLKRSVNTKNKDPDAEFLNSILPEMKSMNARQKILFKGKLFRILEEVFGDNQDFPSKTETARVYTQTAPMKVTEKTVGVTMTNGHGPSGRHSGEAGAPMVTLVPVEGLIKQESTMVDLYD